ncbi:MAG: DNA polymerase III subunit delta' [Chloroflexi bacterium]|nr:DNA polymerase III subunit delta' [Chloroflexota bacterium]
MRSVIGHSPVVSLLTRALESGTMAQAYLLCGPPRVGKMTLARKMAQALNCDSPARPCGQCAACQRVQSANHSDVQVIRLEPPKDAEDRSKTEIGIDRIKDMLHSASLPPFEGRHKVFIVDGAELMSTDAANALLKTLEEPAARTVFILLAVNDRLLPETVRSRCQRLELSPVGAPAIEAALRQRGIEETRARLLARLAHGAPGWAFSAAADDGLLAARREDLEMLARLLDGGYEARFNLAGQLAGRFGQRRGEVYDLLALWLDYWHDLLLVKVGCADFVTNIDYLAALEAYCQGYHLDQVREGLGAVRQAAERLRLNASPRLVFEVMMLDIPLKGATGGPGPAERYG